MAWHVRVQRTLLLGSLLVLASTGLPQKFDSFSTSRWVIDAAGGIETLRSIHHVAGGVLIFACLYHVTLVLGTVLVMRVATPLKMIPGPRDYRDAMQMGLYFLGLSREPVAFEGPSYFQKLDYWVLVWGLTVMAVSGLIRLFPVRMTSVLSADVVAAALQAHSDIALLIAAWVLVVHVAYASLTPALFSLRLAPARALAVAGAAGEPADPPGSTDETIEREENSLVGKD